MTLLELAQGTLDDIAHLASQITYKLLKDKEMNNIKTAYESMSDQQLEHLEIF